MDDFSVASLNESKNEWCARLLSILTPSIAQGLKSIFDEAWKLCQENNEKDKYLMTFQNFLSRVPKWNQTIIDNEKTRICETSGCTYLEELVTCVHIIQLKVLTCVRVGHKQKKVDIDVPSVSSFIHKIYIHVARAVYTNIYLFEKNVVPLQIQKNNREVEQIIKECILTAIRESVPVEMILRAYIDETVENHTEVTEVEETLPVTEPMAIEQAKPEPAIAKPEPAIAKPELALALVKLPEPEPEPAPMPVPAMPTPSKISFSDSDLMVDLSGITSVVNAPKDEETLAKKVSSFDMGDDEDDDVSERISIGDSISLDISDINDIGPPKINLKAPPVLEFEVLH
jgi:hypothetical protein